MKLEYIIEGLNRHIEQERINKKIQTKGHLVLQKVININSTFKVFRKAVVDFDIDDYIENSKLWQEYRTILMNSKDENRVENAKSFYYDHEEEMNFTTLWEGKYNPCELIDDYFTKRLSCIRTGKVFSRKQSCNY